jgi:hypothetical protein
MKTSLIKDKVRKTCLERFGVSSPAKAVSVLKKMSATCNRIYGVSNPLLDPKVQAKRRSTLQRNHGVDTPWKSPEVVAKSQATSMKRYGVRHYMQDPTHFAENLKKKFQRKKVEINGKSHIVQGYEAEVLKRLESKIDRLVTDPTGIPRIDWTDAEGKTHWYFPDAMVQTKDNRKLLLEVKSEYTVLGDAVRLKAKAAWSFCSKLPTLKYVIAVHAPAKGIRWITNLRDLAALQSDLRN